MNINNQHQTNFKGFYNSKNFYRLEQDLKLNPTITPHEVKTIKDSVEASEALNRSIKMGKISANQISDQLMSKYNLPTDFKNDTFLAASAAFAANIMEKMGFVKPRSVVKEPLGQNILGSCSIYSRDVSFADGVNWAADGQDIAIRDRITNFGSSGHFLSTPVHEFMHSVHMKHLEDLQQNSRVATYYPGQIINDKRMEGKFVNMDPTTKSQIKNNISQYGSTNPVEAFAEYSTKVICQNLDKDKDLLPKDYTIFQIFKDPMASVINDFWNADYTKYATK